ncbi:MAG: glycosyltransferase [Sedimenticola sp.]|nr:glycosyltransferase [Sedimenticola sp.]
MQHQAHALRSAGLKVGIISAGLIPWNRLLSKFPYKKHEVDREVTVYRYFVKKIIPGRYLVRFGFGRLIAEHEKLFLKYVRHNGVPDLIHAHNSLYAGVVARHLKSKFKIPFVVTEHGSEYGRNLLNKSQHKDSRQVLVDADCRVVVSNAQKTWVHNLLGLEENIFHVIPNLVEPSFELQRNLARPSRSKHDEFVFLSIGCLDKNKNHSGMLDSFSSSFRDISNVKLRVVGDGRLKSNLVSKAERLGISKQVSFLGELGRIDVRRELINCCALVHSSRFETFGVVLIEALAFGKPVISTSCGGPQDIIVNKKNGLLVPVDNNEQLSLAMNEMVSTYDKYNPETIRNDCNRRFGSKVIVRELIDCYQKVLSA